MICLKAFVRAQGFVPALSGPVRANCDCRVALRLLLQDNVAGITRLKDKCADDADSVTIDEIAQGAACCEPPHPVTAELFCEAMRWLTYINSAACDKIASAGGIPVIVQLLVRFPDEEEVVDNATRALVELSPLSDELAKAALPTIIANVRAHPTRIGYELLSKHIQQCATFHECEGGAEVYDIAVSYAVWLRFDACGARSLLLKYLKHICNYDSTVSWSVCAVSAVG